MIHYGRQHIDDDDINEVISVLRSDYLTQGPKVKEFEENIADYCGAKYSVVFNSGTSALHASYFAAGLSKNDKFITSPITFAATANAGLYLGAKPVFCDINLENGNIDYNEIKKHDGVKVITPVHYGGYPCEMVKIKEHSDSIKAVIVEDACHALGAIYSNTKVGSCRYSDMTVFSFHPVKHITTGEGGAVTTNSEYYYNQLLLFRNHGITKNTNDFVNKSDGEWYHEMQILGYNYRMSDIQAALGISQLRKLDNFLKKRNYTANIYQELLQDIEEVNTLSYSSDNFHAYHLFTILLDSRLTLFKNDIFKYMKDFGIQLQTHYIPVYLHPFYQNIGYKTGIAPTAENFYKRAITLPIFPDIKENEIKYIVEKLKDTIRLVLK